MTGPLHFKRHLVIEQLGSEGLFILSERDEFVFRGPLYARVAPLIDGRHTDDDIARALAPEFPAGQVYFALAGLRRAGFIDDRPSTVPDSEAAFWDALDLQPAAVEVRLLGFGAVELPRFESRLPELGVGIRADAPRALVLTDDYLRVELDRFDIEARERGGAYLLAKPLGLIPWIGPRFRPERPGCLACLAQRLRGHRRVQRFLQTHSRRVEPYPTAVAAWPAGIDAIAGLLATQLQLWAAADGDHPLDRAVVSFDSCNLAATRHTLTVRPQCPRCGDPGLVARLQSRPIELSSSPALARDGGRRREDPHVTFGRLEHHISPITGIVSRMVCSTPAGSTVAHAYFTDHNFVHMTDTLDFLRVSLRSHSGGKGRSDIQAKTSALCESIERYSSVWHGDEATRMASLAQLRESGELAVHPNAIMLYSETQLRERERWNRAGELFCWVPQPFDETAPIAWTPAWSLLDETPRWIPSSLCFYSTESAWMRADSNGAAAGSSLEEAILQGFMELVERDAVALWWYNRLRVPAVDLASFGERDFDVMVSELAARGRELWVLELPTDLGVPCHVAISRRVDQVGEEIVFGFGAHFDAKLSIARALTELHQFLPHIHPGNQAETTVIGRFVREATLEREPYLRADETQRPRRREDHATFDPGDLRADVLRCCELVRARGLELLVQDHTRPDVGLNVVRVIVPGLRHFWARLGPGRLYDVPVALGLLERPNSEHELNPTPLFV